MLREAKNIVKIEGLLSEVDLDYATYNKGGKQEDCIRGQIKVKVKQEIEGKEEELEVPIHMFAGKYTNAGKLNPAYSSIEKVKNEFVSIAAAASIGGEADYVRITQGKISMNEYYAQDERFISFPRIQASFVNKIKSIDCQDEASFSLECVIGSMGYDTNKDGEETDKYLVRAIVPQWGGNVDLIPLCTYSKVIIDNISQGWNEGDTVRVKGRLRFTSETVTEEEELGFGESDKHVFTKNISELVITGGTPNGLDGDYAYATEDIQEALAKRKANLAARKEADIERAKQKGANKPSKLSDDLGF